MLAARHLLPCLLAAVVAGCSGSPTGPDGAATAEVEQRSFSLANQARAEAGGTPPLALSEAVAMVARRHSERMRDEGFFGHRGSDGRDLAARLDAAGISFRAAAENLARTTNIADPAGWAHEQLMASEEHRSNILGPRFRLAGVGVARLGDTYWLTQIFIEP